MDHRQPLACRQLIDQLAVSIGGGIRHHNQSQIPLAPPLGHHPSISLESRSGASTTSTASLSAAGATEACQFAWLTSGLDKMATRATCGAISLRSSSNFAPKLGSKT